MQKLEERMTVEAFENAQREERQEKEAAAKQPKVLWIEDIVTMRQAGLSDDVIAAAIRK
jgi:hypothetical protein